MIVNGSSSSNEDPFATVSSLYGPGTISCWYLTAFSVLISWTFHPHKRKSGSVDVDLIATLTLPAVAAGHLVSQARSLLHHGSNNISVQDEAAIEAPLLIVESFILLCPFLLRIAAWRRSNRRVVVAGTVGLLCLASICYIHFSSFSKLDLRSNLQATDNHITSERVFTTDFSPLPEITVVMLLLPINAIALAFPEPRADQTVYEWLINLSYSFTATSFVRLPVVFMRGNFSDLSNHAFPRFTFWFRLAFFPRTACSITDLDQAVAATAGATILLFTLYSVAKAHYNIRKAKDRLAPGLADIELQGSGGR